MSYDETIGTQSELAKNDPPDTPLTFEEWASKRGYDPKTRTYSKEAE